MPPESLHDWQHEDLLTRPWANINLGSDIERGATVWITACWYNQHGECGPSALPKDTIVQGNVAPRKMERELRIAAWCWRRWPVAPLVSALRPVATPWAVCSAGGAWAMPQVA